LDAIMRPKKKKNIFYTAQPRAGKGVFRGEANFQLDKCRT